MRGNPLLNLALVLACLGTFAVAIASLTGSTPAPANAPAPLPDITTTPCAATLKFAHPPKTAAILHLGEPLWTAPDGSTTTFDFDITLPADLATHGIDLQLTATWPPGTPETVAQLTLEPESLETSAATTWAELELDEVLTFTWPKPPEDAGP